ncbi:MAG: glycosyltransferase [Clostridiales bacterium]|nr:glycosyltransferase [Clostridiales bacterium]
MKKIENNMDKILKTFIIMQPIIDLMTSIGVNCLNMNITIGIIIRTIFLFFIIGINLFIYKKKTTNLYYLITFLYAILYIVGIYIYNDGKNILGEIQGLMRSFYFPLMLLSIYNIKDDIKNDYKILTHVFFMYNVMIFIPNILNVGFKSYEITKDGSIGFFNAANEISAIISIITPFLFIMFEENKNKLFKISSLFIYIYVIVSIGTKTPLLSLFIAMFFFLIWKFIDSYRNKKYKKIIISSIIIVVLSLVAIILIPKTTFYKNIKTHLDYLETESIIDIFKDTEKIDHFIFSQRLTFLNSKKNIYDNSELYEKFIGIGYYNNGKHTKLIEMDYFDVFYSHGIIGFIIYFSIYAYILIKLLKENNKKDKSLSSYINKVSILLILVLSLFTGHITTAPSVSIIAIYAIMMLKEEKQSKAETIIKSNKKNEVVKIEGEDMVDISIIVPIYNSEKYLTKCIDSLLNQTKKEIEFILINDGSTDSTHEIIKKYNDKRIKYYKNENQGIGKTRNFGISKAVGKYIMFIDSDDYIKENTCELLFKKAQKEKAEIVICDFLKVYDDGTEEEIKLLPFKTSSLKDNPNILLEVNLSPWNKLYKTSLIKNNKIKFVENLKYEDAPFVLEALDKSKRIAKLNKSLNYYVIHGKSETTIRDKRIFDILKIVDIIRKKFKDKKYLKEALDKLTVRIVTNYTIQQRSQIDANVGKEFINEAFEYLEKEVPDYKNNKYYKGRGIFRRTIEKNKMLTHLYCKIYNAKNKNKP